MLSILQRIKKSGPGSLKEISVQAWVEDPFGHVLIVKQQASGNWALPGGRVNADEALHVGLRREIKEEVGLSIISHEILDIFDRPDRASLSILYRVTLKRSKIKLAEGEIESAAFANRLPGNSTPTARYFWGRHFKLINGKG